MTNFTPKRYRSETKLKFDSCQQNVSRGGYSERKQNGSRRVAQYAWTSSRNKLRAKEKMQQSPSLDMGIRIVHQNDRQCTLFSDAESGYNATDLSQTSDVAGKNKTLLSRAFRGSDARTENVQPAARFIATRVKMEELCLTFFQEEVTIRVIFRIILALKNRVETLGGEIYTVSANKLQNSSTIAAVAEDSECWIKVIGKQGAQRIHCSCGDCWRCDPQAARKRCLSASSLWKEKSSRMDKLSWIVVERGIEGLDCTNIVPYFPFLLANREAYHTQLKTEADFMLKVLGLSKRKVKCWLSTYSIVVTPNTNWRPPQMCIT